MSWFSYAWLGWVTRGDGRLSRHFIREDEQEIVLRLFEDFNQEYLRSEDADST